MNILYIAPCMAAAIMYLQFIQPPLEKMARYIIAATLLTATGLTAIGFLLASSQSHSDAEHCSGLFQNMIALYICFLNNPITWTYHFFEARAQCR